MRRRWMAVTIGVSALAALTTMSVVLRAAQKGERARAVVAMDPDEQPTPKRWRSPDGQAKAATTEYGLPPAPPVAEVASAPDDPNVAVDTFLRRSQKEADDSIQALTREADALHDRLSRVEAAIGRWRAVSAALRPGSNAPPRAIEEPTRPLDPIPAKSAAEPASSPDDPRPPAPTSPPVQSDLPPTPPEPG